MIIKRRIDKKEWELKLKKKGEFEGYASVFDGVDAVGDTIKKGAFTETIQQKRKPSMFVNHDSYEIPVGDWKHLEEDSKGLLAVGVVDFNHKNGKTLHSAMERGAMDGISIGFLIDESTKNDHGGRTITGINLKEISIVNYPADDDARISVVKREIDTLNSLKDAELFLRDAGTFSRSAATAFVSRLRTMVKRDVSAVTSDEITKLKTQLSANGAVSSLCEFIDNLKVTK